MTDPFFITLDVQYLILIFALFVVPSMLARYHVPGGITALAMGILVSWQLEWFEGDAGLQLLSNFGVISLFLLAGLEVKLGSLKRDYKVLSWQVGLMLLLLGLIVWVCKRWLGMGNATAFIVALVLTTPSTGFILDSLDKLTLAPVEKSWIKSIAISMELVALVVFFIAVKSESLPELAFSTLAFAAMIVLVPLLFNFFARVIAPYSPNSEFAFMLMLAILCGYLTRKLGTYYLVGAFVVGLAAQRFSLVLPAVTSKRMLFAVKIFAFFFMPFYFFKAGLNLKPEQFSWMALLAGAGLFLVMGSIRLALTGLQLRLALGKTYHGNFNIAVSLLPNLVFGIVLTQILAEKGAINSEVHSTLIIYTLLISALPALLVRDRSLADPLPSLGDELLQEGPGPPWNNPS